MSQQAVIVVGVDGTPSSQRALTWAAQEAVRRGAVLRAITAWSPEATEASALAAIDPQTLRESAQQVLREAADQLTTELADPPEIRREVVLSTPAQALISASGEADLVVVGTHGRGPVRAFLLGSVSLSVIKHSACPVVVMPPDRAARRVTSVPSSEATEHAPGLG